MQLPKPLLALNDDEASVLADWHGVENDLKHVVSATKYLLTLLQQPDSNETHKTLVRSLWASALVAYVRCFGTGKRAGLQPEIFASLEGEPIATHDYYKNTRDKHVAHPVNAFEEVRVGVMSWITQPHSA
jgi:hypothetical protein